MSTRVEASESGTWWGICDHGDSEWYIERASRTAALRSLAAHWRDEHDPPTLADLIARRPELVGVGLARIDWLRRAAA